MLGALIWKAFMLEALPLDEHDRDDLSRRSLRWLIIGAWILAATHAIALISKGVVLKETLGHLPWGAYTATVQFKAGLLRMFLSAALAITANDLVGDPRKPSRWQLTWLLALAISICGAWLTHGVGRFENRGLLMQVTVLHQLAGAIWFGGILQLIVLWRWVRRHPGCDTLWPLALRRFALIGVSAVVVLLATGLLLAFSYVDSLAALIGTGYGSLLLIKTTLMLAALEFAWINHRAARKWEKDHGYKRVFGTIPHIVEAESFLLVSILFVAATLSSQPPAVDIPQLIAPAGEVWQMFSPKIPTLTSPTHEQLMIGEIQRATIVGKEAPVFAAQWSNFNHNVAGLFLTIMAAVALLGYLSKAPWANYWPAGFIALGIFLFFRSDAQAWPMGPLGFWESTLGDGEILQHRLATLLTFVLGGLEIRARSNPQARNLRYMFPILCAFGGVLLLTHSHSGFELKTEYLIQSTHMVMGLLAIFMATTRWLELKLEPPYAQWEGLVATTSMALVGLILLFYDEPIY